MVLLSRGTIEPYTALIQLQNNQEKQEGGGAHLPSLLSFFAEENVFPGSCCELLK